MSNSEAALRARALESVEEVVERVAETIEFHEYRCAEGLEEAMTGKYLPGFVTAHSQVEDFWDRFGDKVLRMAGHAAALACFFVERESPMGAARDDKPREVTEHHWLMAMGVVRSACAVGPDQPDPRGLPCNHPHFVVSDQARGAAEKALHSILDHLKGANPGQKKEN